MADLCNRLQHPAAPAVFTAHGSHAAKVRECNAAKCFTAKQYERTIDFNECILCSTVNVVVYIYIYLYIIKVFYFSLASVHHLMGAVAILSQVSLFTLKVLSRSQSDLPLEKFELRQRWIIFTPLSIHLSTSVGI